MAAFPGRPPFAPPGAMPTLPLQIPGGPPRFPGHLAGAVGVTQVQLPALGLLGAGQQPLRQLSITLFVGAISDRVSDTLVREILQKCGRVMSWKRVRGANGNLQAFGFVEYEGPDAALRARRLLTDLRLADKNLKITVDEKNTLLLDEYRQGLGAGAEELEQAVEDAKIRAEIEELLQTNVPPADKQETSTRRKSAERDSGRRDSHRDADRDRDRERDRERERDRRERERSRERDVRDRRRDEDEDARKAERKRRDDEQLYRERERGWEKKEKERLRDMERDADREAQRQAQRREEAARALEMMATYNDATEDTRHYSTSTLQRKRREREREAEGDDRDRAQELEERLKAQPLSPAQPMQQPAAATPDQAPHEAGARRLTAAEVFGGGEEVVEAGRKKKRLAYVTFNEQELLAAGMPPDKVGEEKKRLVKALIDRIPTGRDELFAFDLDWAQATPALFERKIMPWVGKKISEYIGEEEPNLAEYICDKVRGRATASELEGDVAQVLDDEARVFVVKLWRLLVYETEAARLGLA